MAVQNSSKGNIYIIDRHRLIGECIAKFLCDQGFTAIATTDFQPRDPADQNQNYDLVLADLSVPGLGGRKGIDLLKAEFVGAKIAVLVDQSSPHAATETLNCGVDGIVLRNMPARALISAVNFMLSGEAFVPIAYMTDAFSQDNGVVAPNKGLTKRELGVLRAMARGASNATIAEELDFAPSTIKTYVSIIIRKLAVENRTMAVFAAQTMGLI